MKFYIEKIVLWLDSGEQKELKFLNNKVNIITGDPSKGKSSIIEIIDFCFFASNKSIVEGDDYISKVEWFGINFHINDKHFTLIRHSKNIKDYYFSSTGEIPSKPSSNISEKIIKKTLNYEFNIDDNVVFPYGGDKIKKGNKISLRYFLLFCTQRRDTLSSSEVLFDKQNGTKYLRYQEALERIFDIALGVTTIENLIKRETLFELEIKKSKFEKKQKLSNEETHIFSEEIRDICNVAKKLNLLDLDILSEEGCQKNLQQLILKYTDIETIDNQSKVELLEQEKLELQLKLSRYKKYVSQYEKYKKLLENDVDSLKPITYLDNNFSDILALSKTDILIQSLQVELKSIQEFIKKTESPAIIDLESKINNLKSDIVKKSDEIKNISIEEKNIASLKTKQLLFLGETKQKLKFYNSEIDKEDLYIEDINQLDKKIERLKKEINDIDRGEVLDLLSDYMQLVFDEVEYNLSGYDGYKPILDYKTKLIHLKKLDKKKTIENIGSSSNHLFLHLAFFTAIHRVFIKKNVAYVPQFLILDQPDSPYYETNQSSDERTIFFQALKTLDKQIDYFNEELKEDFQIIVLEHIEWKEIKNGNFNNFHLVAEWRNGQGLI